jgi:hypothetical protein
MTQIAETQVATAKRVVFTMGGKGGVGKTGVMVALAEWFPVRRDSLMTRVAKASSESKEPSLTRGKEEP